MSFLIPEEEIRTLQEKYEREHRTPAQILVRVARDPEFAGATVAELATAAERSQSWVRRTLKAAGIVPVKPPRRQRLRIKAGTLCAMCGHPRGGVKAITLRLASHCIPGTQHGHWSNPATYVCDKRHCLSFNFVDGKAVPCGCPDFVPPQRERVKHDG
jgi:hypothetical protein